MAWRLDLAKYGAKWDSGEGAYRVGGRWNARNRRVVYCSVDPATAIMEIAVHKGCRTLDTVSHVLTTVAIDISAKVVVINPADVPNPNWLRPGIPSAGQQQFGDALLARYAIVFIPSVVSPHSWNMIFDRDRVEGLYKCLAQEPFALNTRLYPTR